MNFRVAVAVLASLRALGASGDALIEAARGDDHKSAAALLRQGADANARDEDGSTALSWAANHSNVALAELLLDKGYEVYVACLDSRGEQGDCSL